MLRYGLEGEAPLTLKEIGRRLGVTREWVRKIEVRAVRKLDNRHEADPLAPRPSSTRPRQNSRRSPVETSSGPAGMAADVKLRPRACSRSFSTAVRRSDRSARLSPRHFERLPPHRVIGNRTRARRGLSSSLVRTFKAKLTVVFVAVELRLGQRSRAHQYRPCSGRTIIVAAKSEKPLVAGFRPASARCEGRPGDAALDAPPHVAITGLIERAPERHDSLCSRVVARS